jgi:heptosyltransferase III
VAVASVLVIHPGALGDVLLAIPALRMLRARCPDERLVLAAQSHLGRLLFELGEVDEARAFESLGLEALFVEDGEPVSLPAISAAARVVSWFGSRDATFARRLRALAPNAVIASSGANGARPVWQHLMETVGADGEAARGLVAVSPALGAEGREALREAGWDGHRRVLMVHAGAGGLDKRWPIEGFAGVVAELVRRHDLAVVLHEGPADKDAVAALAERMDALILKQPTLPCLAGALCHVTAWLGNDSGVTHLAAAIGRPTVALFGAERIAWRPWSTTARVVVVEAGRLREDVSAITSTLDGLASS